MILELNDYRLMYDSSGLSQKIYTKKAVIQVKLDIVNKSFRIINATNNLCLFERSGTKSQHVLKRWAKAKVEEMFNVKFKREKRPKRLGKKTYLGGSHRS